MIFVAILVALGIFIFVGFAVDMLLTLRKEKQISLEESIKCQECGHQYKTIEEGWILVYHDDSFAFTCPHCGHVIKVNQRLRWKLGK